MYETIIATLRDMSKMGMKYGMAVVKMQEAADAIEELNKRTVKGNCKICARNSTVLNNNTTRCPLEEHFALPDDGYCYLYEPPKEKVFGQYTDTAGKFHWCGTHSGEHTIKTEDGET